MMLPFKVMFEFEETVIIVTVMVMAMFMVLSSLHSHCKGSPSSFDECSMSHDECQPAVKVRTNLIGLSYRSA